MADETPATSKADREPQTPDQFTTGPEPTEDQEAPASHATKGMTVLGYTEASRIPDSHIAHLAEQKRADRRAAREK